MYLPSPDTQLPVATQPPSSKQLECVRWALIKEVLTTNWANLRGHLPFSCYGNMICITP